MTDIRIEKPTKEDIEKAKKSPWYQGYIYGRESVSGGREALLERAIFDALQVPDYKMRAILEDALATRPSESFSHFDGTSQCVHPARPSGGEGLDVKALLDLMERGKHLEARAMVRAEYDRLGKP